MAKTNLPTTEALSLDVLVIGAGFSGIYALHRLRQRGLRAKIFEASTDYGGVWHYNHYPGARVDSEWPFYQLNIPEVQETWTFTERFCDHNEIRQYIAHAAQTLGLGKDTVFGARVNEARFDQETGKWTIKTEAGHTAVAQHIILATGLFYRNLVPRYAGLDQYQGRLEHTAAWPDSIEVKGKKIAVIGAGATGIQVVQELSKEASELTLMLRRPSYCLPMVQRRLSREEQVAGYAYFPVLFEAGRKSMMGMPVMGQGRGVLDAPPEEREALFEKLWEAGGFNFLTRNFNDFLVSMEANRIVCGFWAKKTRARFTDKSKADIMAPLEPPYPFGTKRQPLEQDYYDCLDQPHVKIIDLNKTLIENFSTNGLLFSDGIEREYDIVVLATGFDTVNGSLGNMGLKNTKGIDFSDSWKDGVHTYLGMMFNGFPNAFTCFSVHAPTALSNGPTVLECQLDWIVDAICKLREENYKSIEPTEEAETRYKDLINTMANKTLFPLTSSWWTGGNIDGRQSQNLTYLGGIGGYEALCREKLADWDGFHLVTNGGTGTDLHRSADEKLGNLSETSVKEERVCI